MSANKSLKSKKKEKDSIYQIQQAQEAENGVDTFELPSELKEELG